MTREDAKAFMQKAWRETTKGSYAEEAYEMAIKALEQPTIEERKTGKWILWNYPGAECARCSVCGEEYDQIDLYIGGNDYPKFCPNCGADMRGESDDIPIEYFESGGK